MPSSKRRDGYSPIPANPPSQTRILTLQHGDVSSPLKVTLTIEDVRVCDPYDALSYVWGKEKSKNFLIRDGQPAQIQANLDAALRCLRLPNKPVRLWVDAVCIDQENLSERSSQVQIMRLIYTHAKTVIIWLGPEIEGISGAIRLARQLHEIRKDLEYVPNTTLQRSPAAGHSLSLDSVKEYVNPDADEWKDLERLFMQEWWERVWCIQELVVSSKCIGRCGNYQIEMETLLSAAIYIVRKRGRFFGSKSLIFWNDVYLKKFRTSRGEVGHWSASGTTNLINLLEAVKLFEATDPRDRVFALVSMSIEGVNQSSSLSTVLRRGTGPSRSTVFKFFTNLMVPSKDVDRIIHEALKPSYTTSHLDVYRDITRFLILHNGLLHILSHVQHPQEITASNTGHFLTWVPRWDERPSAVSMGNHSWFLAGLSDGYRPYLSREHHDRLYARTKSPTVLSLDGFQYDRVAKVSEIITVDMDGILSIEDIWNQLFDTAFPPSDASGTRILEDLGLALMGGQPFERPYGPEGLRVTASKISLPPGNFFLRGAAITLAYSAKHYRFHKTHVRPSVLRNTLPNDDNDTKFQDLVKLVTHNRRVYITNKGLLGLGPMAIKPGDRICVLIGGRIPFVVRPAQRGWILVGEAYLHDVRLMAGKVANDVLSRKHMAQLETFDFC